MIGGVWHRDTVGWVLAVCALPAAVVGLGEGGADAVWRFCLSLVVIGFWQGVFLVARAQPLSPIAIVTAVAVTILAPGAVSDWQLILALSFGTVLGEQIFGGWGRNIINAAVATLAFLYFGFPEIHHSGFGPLLGLASLPAALILVATGIVAWQVLLAAIAGVVAATLLMGGDATVLVSQGSLAFGLVFLVADPVASAATRGGRWAYGLLAGGLIAVFGWGGGGIDAPHAVVFAALLASLFAPLIDAGVLALMIGRRKHGHG